METIEQMWDSFAAKVYPPTTSEVQITECRRAFYGGAWGLLTRQKAYSGSEMSDEAGVAWLESLWHEIEDFYADVKAGRK